MPATPVEAPTLRVGARVLLLDPDDRILLIHAKDPDAPEHHWWELPGGGAEPGESLADTAQREFTEETGILLDRLGPHLWDRETRFHYRVESTIGVRAFISPASPTPRPPCGPGKADLIEHRWWTRTELAACRDKLLPPNLPALFADVVNGALRQPVVLHA